MQIQARFAQKLTWSHELIHWRLVAMITVIVHLQYISKWFSLASSRSLLTMCYEYVREVDWVNISTNGELRNISLFQSSVLYIILCIFHMSTGGKCYAWVYKKRQQQIMMWMAKMEPSTDVYFLTFALPVHLCQLPLDIQD